MLYFAKFGGIAVLVWFYLTAKEKGEPAFKWAIIGLIGYWLAWWIVNLTAVPALTGTVAKTLTTVFLVKQIPAVSAIAAAFIIRKKLLADAAKEHTEENI